MLMEIKYYLALGALAFKKDLLERQNAAQEIKKK